MLRTHKVRADTTVVAANVRYPTDAGLLARAIAKLAATIGRLQAAGGASRTRVQDRRRSARRRAHQLAKTPRGRSEQATQMVLRTTGELVDLATQAVGDATPGGAATPAATWARAGDQACGRLARLVSLHDPDARPIVKDALASRSSSATRPR